MNCLISSAIVLSFAPTSSALTVTFRPPRPPPPNASKTCLEIHDGQTLLRERGAGEVVLEEAGKSLLPETEIRSFLFNTIYVELSRLRIPNYIVEYNLTLKNLESILLGFF